MAGRLTLSVERDLQRGIMRGLSILQTCVLALTLPGNLALGSDLAESQPHETLFQDWKASTPKPSFSRSPLRRSFTVTPLYFRQDPQASQRLLDDGGLRDAMDLSLKSSFGDAVSAEGQIAYSAFDSKAERMNRESRNRLLRLKLDGGFSSFDYGAEYRSVGPSFRSRGGSSTFRRDQVGTEMWAGYKVGRLHLKATFSESADNVEEDPQRPRTTRTLAGPTLGITLPGSATLTLSYQRGTSHTTWGGRLPQEHWVDTYGTSFYLGRSSWDVYANSEYALSRNKLDTSLHSTAFFHQIGGSYHPTDSLHISPYLSLNEERSSWTVARTITPAATLSLTYALWSGGPSLSLSGEYSRTRITDGTYDVATTYIINSLVLPIANSKNTDLSFDVIHSQYSDLVYTMSSYDEVLGRVMFRVLAR
jgi:hypothetical protein